MKQICVLFALFALSNSVTGFSQVEQSSPQQFSRTEIEAKWQELGFEIPRNWSVVTDPNEVRAFGENLTNSLNAQDVEATARLLSVMPMMKRNSFVIPDAALRKVFVDSSVGGEKAIAKKWCQGGNTYRFLGVKKSEVGPVALVRFRNESGEFNYYFWRTLRKNGTLVGADAYVIGKGETMSDDSWDFISTFAPNSPSSMEGYTENEQRKMKQRVDLAAKIQEASDSGNSKEFLELYQGLPDEFRNRKSIAMMAVSHSHNVSSEVFLETLRDYQDRFNVDGSISFLLLSKYLVSKQYEDVLSILPSLINEVGEDAYILEVKSYCHAKSGRYAEALKCALQAIKTEPDTDLGYSAVALVTAMTGNYSETARVTKKLYTEFGYRDFQFEESEEYSDFVESEHYARLLTWIEKENDK